MMMGEEQPLLPHARFCEAYPLSLWCLRRGAPGANRERRYLCSIRRDLFAGGTRCGGRGCRETSTPQLWDNQVPPPLQSPAPPQLSNARIRTPLAVMDLSWLQLYLSSFYSL